MSLHDNNPHKEAVAICMLYEAQSTKATKEASAMKYECCYAQMSMLQP